MSAGIQKKLQQGFLLTRHVYDSAQGLMIELWVKTAEAVVQLVVEGEYALFFIETAQAEQAINLLITNQIKIKKTAALPLKTFSQKKVTGFYFSHLQHFYAARDMLKQANITCYEDDIRPDDRYLMERFITAGIEFVGVEQNQQSNYKQYRQVKCKAYQADISKITLKQLSIDIECSLDGALYSIAAYSNQAQVVFMIGQPTPCPLDYIVWVTDEKDLLAHFFEWLSVFDADVIIGWNVINFDMQLLQKRCDLYDILFVLGRDNKKVRWRTNPNSEQVFLAVNGRLVLDGIDLLKTATYNFNRFSLDFVANELLGIGKKVIDSDNRMAEINHNFQHNKPALAAYNLEDCRLVSLIFAKTDLLAFALLRAQLTGLTIDRVGGSVAAFTNLYLPKLHRSGYVAPNIGDGVSTLVSPGGYVMDSTPGLYDNVLVLDFKSLYPSIIRTFKIDPLGLVEGLIALKNNNTDHVIAGFDGAYFSRRHHFLPAIITELWQARDRAKRQKNSPLSQAIKIIMNSFYGVLGSTGCRFFDPRLSGAITKRSHQLLKETKMYIEKQGFSVIYGDTDSIFVHIGKDYSPEQAQQLGKKLEQKINRYWAGKIQKMFQLNSELEIEFETHFSRFLMPTIRGSEAGSKKRYAGLVIKNNQQQLIFKGLESVRTDWTELAKQFQRELYHRIFNQLPVKDYIRSMVAKTLAGEVDHLLLYRKRLRRKLSHYIKNVPPHVKAARFADSINAAKGKPLKYQNRGWISYYITLDGPQAKEYLTSSLDYDFYIDRQLKAVADGILPFIGTSFTEITDSQLGLF
jgi:DNA polymerase-2